MTHSRALLLVAVSLVAGASAARFPVLDLLIGEAEPLPGLLGVPTPARADESGGHGRVTSLAAGLAQVVTDAADSSSFAASPEASKAHGWGPIPIATKYVVRPDMHPEFLEEWRRFEAGSDKVKGIRHLALNKVAGDNLVWSSYSEYEDGHAAFEHMRSKALHRFGRFLMDHDVPIEYRLLIKVGGCHCHCHGPAAASAAGGALATASCFDATQPSDEGAGALRFPPAPGGSSGGEEELAGDGSGHRAWPVRLVSTFLVKPSHAHAFVREWEDLAGAMAKHKGVLAFVLHKPADDNFAFVAYTAYACHGAFMDAVHTKAAMRFLEFVADKDIGVVSKKLWRVPAHRRA